jgi:hypothetical protein
MQLLLTKRNRRLQAINFTVVKGTTKACEGCFSIPRALPVSFILFPRHEAASLAVPFVGDTCFFS